MFKIRERLYETNSSSVHTLVFANESQYNKFLKGDIAYDPYNKVFLTRIELEEEYLKWLSEYLNGENNYTNKSDFIKDTRIITMNEDFDYYWDSFDVETQEVNGKTKYKLIIEEYF